MGREAVLYDLNFALSDSQEMATSDPCANAPPTPPEEPEPNPSSQKKQRRRKLDQSERNKGIFTFYSDSESKYLLFLQFYGFCFFVKIVLM